MRQPKPTHKKRKPRFVAQQTYAEGVYTHSHNWNLHFCQIQYVSAAKKSISLKRKYTLGSANILFVGQVYYITRISNLQEILKNSFGIFLSLPFVVIKRLALWESCRHGAKRRFRRLRGVCSFEKMPSPSASPPPADAPSPLSASQTFPHTVGNHPWGEALVKRSCLYHRRTD